MRKFTFSGVDLLEEPSKQISRIYEGKPEHWHLVAVSTVNSASLNLELRTKLNQGIAICDSTPLFWCCSLIGRPIGRMRGADFMRLVLDTSPQAKRHFFLGSSDEVLRKLILNISKNYPNVNIAGTYAPLYGTPTQIIESVKYRISETRADVLWIGLGSPKQDILAWEFNSIHSLTTLAVGAAFDYISGEFPEAPEFLRGSGLEWTYRLIREPKRLWKRYLLGNLWFLILFSKEIFLGSKKYFMK